nr:immunoglobulin heavy chain junction region [Macaca mulatta]MPO14389.1 immunoglobulin heavy chain junction region [Macaca mulatta]MPO14390.1 immunoglobulin heavy chain junction region [Macaca mulatta]MPO14395.1 immunoglobulin heavy chain junction region [Macaca mulatta]MPO14396.1 immunoglobulin heavy chain junction region [Macaca mulatta]
CAREGLGTGVTRNRFDVW